MTDAENQNSQMTLRPRGRSALSDISNTLAQSISNMTKRVVAPGKKRKLTVSIFLCFMHFYVNNTKCT
jgi:hypothetical protein